MNDPKHKYLTRPKIEAVVKNPNHSTIQEHKNLERRKGNANIDKLSNAVLSADTGKLEECRYLRLGKDKKKWTNYFSN